MMTCKTKRNKTTQQKTKGNRVKNIKQNRTIKGDDSLS
jgi:hypothetical protein